MSHYKPYPAYKDSGVEWLGRVPEHWAVCKLSYRYSIELGKMLDEKRLTKTSLVPYLRNQDVQWGSINTQDLPEMDIHPEELERYTIQDGDLLVCEGGDVGRAAIWRGESAAFGYQKALHRLRHRSVGADTAEFFYFSLLTAKQRGVFEESDSKATIAHLPAEKFRQYRFAFPSLLEQRWIATHLDRETARIDALVEKKTLFIELLREKRQALITHSVTKGLDPNVKMKNSGVEWLGEVPEHWEMVPLKYVTPSLTVGIVVNPSDYVADEGLPFLYGGDIGEGVIFAETARRISPEHSQRNAKTRLSAGDLVTVRVGAPGVTAVVPPDCEGGNCASVMLIRRGAFESDWLCYVMNSRVVRYQVEVVQYGAAQEQFNISHAVDFLIPVPPLEEQAQIASALNQEGRRVDALISRTKRSIELLKERRSAVITAAVTGQIDLREAV